MRILQISHAYPPTFGGVESHVHDLAHRLAGRGHETLCLVGGVGEEGVDQPGARVKVTYTSTLTVQSLLAVERAGKAEVLVARERFLDDLGAVASTFKPDLIHMHNAHHFSPMPAVATLSKFDIPCVNTVHDRAGEHVFAEVLDLQWAHSLYVSKYVAEALPSSSPNSIIWLGIDLANYTPIGAVDTRLSVLSGPVIFHPARMLEWKGLHVSVKALAILRRRGINASLVLCGSTNIVDDPAQLRAYRSKLEGIIADLDLGDAVHFMDFERTRMADAYRASDLVWYPTIDPEPLGLAPIEAMATGTPVVVSDVGGMRETVRHEQSGLRVRANDEGDLADASARILSDQTLRDRLTSGGLWRSRAFNLEAYVDSVERLYKELTSGKHK